MTDQQIPLNPVTSSQPSQAGDPTPVLNPSSAVDDIVSQAGTIQDLFQKNDQTAADQNQQPSQSDSIPEEAVISDPIPNTQEPIPLSDSPPQKSPLDILEEILKKEEKKEELPVETGPSPEDLAKDAEIKAQNLAQIEAQRQLMMSETQSDEQKQRDAIRQQQMDANKINNPYEIRQIEHTKVTE